MSRIIWPLGIGVALLAGQATADTQLLVEDGFSNAANLEVGEDDPGPLFSGLEPDGANPNDVRWGVAGNYEAQGDGLFVTDLSEPEGWAVTLPGDGDFFFGMGGQVDIGDPSGVLTISGRFRSDGGLFPRADRGWYLGFFRDWHEETSPANFDGAGDDFFGFGIGTTMNTPQGGPPGGNEAFLIASLGVGGSQDNFGYVALDDFDLNEVDELSYSVDTNTGQVLSLSLNGQDLDLETVEFRDGFGEGVGPGEGELVDINVFDNATFNFAGFGSRSNTGEFSHFSVSLEEADDEVLVGDMNFDGVVDTGDVAPFVLALTDPEAYQSQFGVDEATMIAAGDINEDGALDTGDVAPFVQLLVGDDTAAVPEPGSLALLAAAGAIALMRRRRAA